MISCESILPPSQRDKELQPVEPLVAYLGCYDIIGPAKEIHQFPRRFAVKKLSATESRIGGYYIVSIILEKKLGDSLSVGTPLADTTFVMGTLSKPIPDVLTMDEAVATARVLLATEYAYLYSETEVRPTPAWLAILQSI